MKKIVIKSVIEGEKSRRRAIKTVAGVPGVESVSVDMEEGKLTVIGETDPVFLTRKLRKFGFRAELLSVGPAKEEKKIGGMETPGVHKKAPAIENKRGSNQYLGVQNMGLNRGIEDEGSEKRIKEAVEGFGDFIWVQVNVKQGMVTVVGDLVPVRLAIQIRELGYRAKLLNVGSAGADIVVKAKEGPDSVPYPNPSPYRPVDRAVYSVVGSPDSNSVCCIV